MQIKLFVILHSGRVTLSRQLQAVLAVRYGKTPTITDLLAGKWQSEAAEIVVSCATDGNHGRYILGVLHLCSV